MSEVSCEPNEGWQLKFPETFCPNCGSNQPPYYVVGGDAGADVCPACGYDYGRRSSHHEETMMSEPNRHLSYEGIGILIAGAICLLIATAIFLAGVFLGWLII